MGYGRGRNYVSDTMISTVIHATMEALRISPEGVTARQVAQFMGCTPVKASYRLGIVYRQPGSPLTRTVPEGHNTCVYRIAA